jgi:enediyne biosynthesis protein E7
MATRPPGPKGEELGRLNYERWRTDMFGFLAALSARYGDIAGFDLGRSPCILVNGAPQVRELLVVREACLRKPEFVKDSNRGYWGDGLTTLEASAWQTRRRLLQPFFSAAHVAARLPIVAECTADLLDGWAPESVTDVLRGLRTLTARIAARMVLDADVTGFASGAGRSGMVPLEEVYGEEYAGAPGGDPSAAMIGVRPRAPRRMTAVVRIIDERLTTGEQRGDVLSDLVLTHVPDGQRLTRDEVVGEVIQMLFAGHLTIPWSLLHFWRDLVDAGRVANVAAEADRHSAGGVRDPAVLSGAYCLAALKESLRLHPAAPLLYREVETAFVLDGFEFHRDVAVWVSPRLLHRDPRYFSDPDRFLPERFMTRRVAVPAGCAYLPFGAGPRACIGSQLALQQMTLISLMAAPWLSSARTLELFAHGAGRSTDHLT